MMAPQITTEVYFSWEILTRFIFEPRLQQLIYIFNYSLLILAVIKWARLVGSPFWRYEVNFGL